MSYHSYQKPIDEILKSDQTLNVNMSTDPLEDGLGNVAYTKIGTGGATNTDSITGGLSYQFDGTTYFETTSDPFANLEEFTVQVWIKPSSLVGSNLGIISAWDNATTPSIISLEQQNGSISFSVAGNGISVPGLIANEWNHVVARIDKDGNQFLCLNVDDTNQGVSTLFNPTVFRNNSYIGNELGFSTRTFDGLIDSLTITGKALTKEQIQESFLCTKLEQPISPNLQAFQINGCVERQAYIDSIGVTFQPTVSNVVDGPVTWTLDNVTGDILNAIIDATTGVITYDGPTEILNNSNASLVVTATDANGISVTREFCFKVADPIDVNPLGCNADMAGNVPLLAAKYILQAKVESDTVFTDTAATTAASDGQDVLALADANGNGNLTVRAGNAGPTYVLGLGPNNTDYLQFDAANSESLQYDVPAAPAAGSAFSLFTLVSMTEPQDQAKVFISSTTSGNNNTTAVNTWQIGSGQNSLGTISEFVFRSTSGFTNVVLGTASGSDLFNDALLKYLDFADGQPHLVFVDYDGTTLKMYVDGQLYVQADPVDNLLGQHIKLFENRNGTTYAEGRLYEAIYGDSTLTDDDKLCTQAYFLCKFGLDAAALAATTTFTIETDVFYDQASQYELHTYSDGSSKIFDTFTGTYINDGDIPVPKVGLLETPEVKILCEKINATVAASTPTALSVNELQTINLAANTPLAVTAANISDIFNWNITDAANEEIELRVVRTANNTLTLESTAALAGVKIYMSGDQ